MEEGKTVVVLQHGKNDSEGTWAHAGTTSQKAKDCYMGGGNMGDDDDPDKKNEKWFGALARTQVFVLRSYRGSYNTLFALLDFSI